MQVRARWGVPAVSAAVLVAAGLGALASAGADVRAGAGPTAALGLGVLLAWAGTMQVHVLHRGGTEASDLFDVVLAVCALAFAGPVLVPLALVAKAGSQALERVEPRKAVFNAATAAASAAAMAVVLAAGDGLPLLPALALAILAGWVVNHLALLAVLSVAGLRAEVATAAALRRWAVQGVVSGALGLLLALAWIQTPLAVLLFVVPLAALHHAGRALSRAAAERRRLAETAAASRVLSSGTAADLEAYLDRLRAAFGAQAAYLVTSAADGPVVAGGPLVEPVRAWLSGLPHVLPPEQAQRFRLELPDRVEVLGVRLRDGGDGVLAVVDPRGERDSASAELATTAAAAREISAFLDAQAVRAAADQEHQRMEVVLRSVADGIVTVGPDRTLLSFNSAAADITGLTAKGALGHTVDVLSLSTPDGQTWEPVPGQRVEGARLQLRTLSGTPRHVDVSTSPAVVDGQECSVLVLRDVTSRVEQERAREQFVVGLGHELRTPLTPLLGWARTLRRRPDLLDGPERQHMVDALDTESARLARLVDNLLTAVDPTSLIARRTTVDLVELVETRLRQARTLLMGRPVTVTSDGHAEVTTNARAVAQVLDNLLSNVARYTPAGSPLRIRIGVVGGIAAVEVADSGPGVPEEAREEIFGLFVRGEAEQANPGVGMGLAVSRSLARSLGGDLVCRPRSGPDTGDGGTGAAFQLVLPVHVVPRQAEVAVVSQLFGT